MQNWEATLSQVHLNYDIQNSCQVVEVKKRGMKTIVLAIATTVVMTSLVIAIISGAIPFPTGTANKSYQKSMAEASSNLTMTQNIVSNPNARIAFIEPTFTHAAYANSFYVFYNKHINEPNGKAVTTDLPFLTAQIDPIAEQSSSHRFLSLVNNVKTLLPNSKIQVLTDEGADAGAIFNKPIKNDDSNHTINAFDILILGHQEYVTQKEYNNFKQFVQNGGKIIFLDGNVFFAEVKYDRVNSTITLVKGHWWEFDGKAARASVGERWKNETSQWVGSNYLCYSCSITFANNPFSYRHHEEQYISNPKDVILLNYRASDPNHTIATYELTYGKGKSVVVGLYSDDIIRNEKFVRFFDRLLLRQLP